MFDLASIRRMNAGARGRLSNAAILEGVSYQGKPKRVAHNSIRYVAHDGAIVYRHHFTDVVTLCPDGSEILNSGGWRTVTTKDRINRFSHARVRQRKGEWFVVGMNGNLVPFEDGMKIGNIGYPINGV